MNVAPETISRFERGETLSSLVRQVKLAEVYEFRWKRWSEVAPEPLDQTNEIAAELKGLARDDRGL